MQILADLSQVRPEPSCLIVGFFDGVHRGHVYLIGQASASARRQGLRAVLLTFYPHPSVVLRGAEPFHLSSREEKLALLSALDLDLIIIEPFTLSFAQTRAGQFVDQLITQIGMVELWVVPNFAMGYRREGDVQFLRQMGEERAFAVNVVNRLKLDGAPISSSRIREALREGNVTLAARCLGRPYSLQGQVVMGAQGRGRSLGFPTANIEVPTEQAMPAHGVYAAWARLRGEAPTSPDLGNLVKATMQGQSERSADEQHRAVVNIGTRPTFDTGVRTIEAHLLDFDRDIYGQHLIIDFVAHLRSEQRFNGAETLVDQIAHDVAQARQLLHDV